MIVAQQDISPVMALAQDLRRHPSIQSKLAIGKATRALGLDARGEGRPGDDAAVLPREGGFDLFAGEGFIPAFVADDPLFAGWCAVMVNLSDIAAMGGRATAIINQIWAPTEAVASPLLQGLREASAAYGVPIVGGHTNFAARELSVAASVFGRAEHLITSFDAAPGNLLIAAIDHRGAYRNFDNFFSATGAPPARLRGDLALLPELAQEGLVRAGKDISQGGIVGTALMLAECSGTGVEIDLTAVNQPDGVPLSRWLRSFPSFGFLLAVAPDAADLVRTRFAKRDITAAVIGRVTHGSEIILRDGKDTALFWNHATDPYLDLGGSDA